METEGSLQSKSEALCNISWHAGSYSEELSAPPPNPHATELLLVYCTRLFI